MLLRKPQIESHTCEERAAVGEQDFGLAKATRIQQNIAAQGVKCRLNCFFDSSSQLTPGVLRIGSRPRKWRFER